MNTVNQTAWANFKKNRGKNILTGIAIVLTTVLVFVIPTIGFGQIDAQMAAVNELYPTFHGMYRGVDEKTVEEMRPRAEVEVMGLRQDVAQIPIEDGVVQMLYCDETMLKLGKTDLETGYPPERDNEIAVSEGILEQLGITAGIGDTIQIPFQVIEPDGLGYEQTDEFVITGILPTTKEQREANSYFALASKGFMEDKQPEDSRKYRVVFRIAGADSMTMDAIEKTFEEMAADLGIPQSNVVSNGDYLWANYVDPAFYTGVVVVLFVVVLAGILTICSIYYISIIYKVQEYGKIKALGATKKQIRQMVFREGMLVAGIAIPIGLALGSVFAKVGLRYLWTSFAGNDLVKMIGQVIAQNKINIWKPWIFGMAIVVTLLTVAVSLVRPMQIASQISPVEAMRYDGGMKIQKKKRKGHQQMSLAGLTGANLSRNKKRTGLTVVTLSLTGILFMILSTILSCADAKEIARESMFDDLRISVDSQRGDKMHPEREWTVICKNNPLNSSLEKEILRIPGVKQITKSSELQIWLKDLLDEGEPWGSGLAGIPEAYASRMEDCIVQGKVTYEELLQGDKVVMNKSFLHWAPDWKLGDTVNMVLECGDGQVEKSFEIVAIADMPEGLSHYADFLLPKETVDALSGYDMDYYWSIDTDKKQTKSVEEALKTILKMKRLKNNS